MKLLSLVAFLLLITYSCKQADKKVTSENNIDAARNFIRAALDGKFSEAKEYMIADSVNLNYLDVAERSYEKNDQDTKNKYRASSINIHEVIDPVKDSVSVIVFSNSFKNDHDTLKVIRQNGQWKVDLKYLYEHDMDTILRSKTAVQDTIRRGRTDTIR